MSARKWRVAWKLWARPDGVSGHGDYLFTGDVAKSICDASNREHPDLLHWAEQEPELTTLDRETQRQAIELTRGILGRLP